MNINEIDKILPHSYPFLLVDRVIDINEKEKTIKAIKCVSANEPFFQGHFPNYKVMPGVLLIETMAQVGAIVVLKKEENKGKIAFLTGVEKARFKKEVIPGDVLEIKVKLIKERFGFGFAEGEINVGGQIVCKASISFAIQ